MIPACRLALHNTARLTKAGHAGLVLSRCLIGHEDTGEKQGKQKRDLIERARKASQEAVAIYRKAYDRWVSETDRHAHASLSTRGRLAVGLGNESPLEVGLTLHHTYGTPMIPGSALKGLCRHYCIDISKKQNDPRIERFLPVLFGTTEDSGNIAFEDAWITPDSLTRQGKGILLDVLTPHHVEYYRDNKRLPTDFDSPVPVPFVSVAGDFRIALECDIPGEMGDRWANFALTMLKNALKYWGAGGKTRAGYGRMDGLAR